MTGTPPRDGPTDHPAPADGTSPWLADLAGLGLGRLAYVRPLEADGQRLWGVFAADGGRLGLASSREMAQVAARQSDLEPVSVH